MGNSGLKHACLHSNLKPFLPPARQPARPPARLPKPPNHPTTYPQGQEKMSKSDPNSAIFMEDTEAEVKTKIKKAFCPPQQVRARDQPGLRVSKRNNARARAHAIMCSLAHMR